MTVAAAIALLPSCGGKTICSDPSCGNSEVENCSGPLCGISCAGVCDKADEQGCGGATCKEDCADFDRLAREADCEDEWAATLSCAYDNSDALCATSFNPCESEGGALESCVGSYCTANPSAEGCL